jgi:multiple sugar transport system substrate-binding protein
MNKLLSTLLGGAVFFTAAAASAQTLTIAGRDGGYADALEVAVEAFLEENPGVEVERLELTGGGLLDTVTIAMREGSSAYDVIMLDDPWAPEFMGNGWLANLSELGGGVDQDFVEPARNVSRYPYAEGPYFAVPFVGNVELFAYNKAMFDKHGLSRPASWTDVVAAARTIDEAEEGVSGAVFRGQKANPIVTGFLPILWAHGARIIDADGNAALNSEAAVDALELYLELAQYAPRGVVNYNSTEVRDALQEGDTAIAIEVWPAWVPSLDDPAISEVVGDIEIMAAPGQVEGPAPMLGSWLVAIPETSENKALARDFIDFLTSPEMQKRLALEVGTPPTRASVYADEEVVSAYRWYPAQVAALNEAQPRPRTAQWARLETILGDYLQLALIGEMEPAEAIEEAHGRIERALAD